MNEQSKLWEKIVSYEGNAPRAIIVAYVKAVVQEVEDAPFEMLTRVEAGENLSKGELLASKLITALGQQEWLDSDEALDDILSSAGQLDIDSSDQRAWQELVAKVNRL